MKKNRRKNERRHGEERRKISQYVNPGYYLEARCVNRRTGFDRRVYNSSDYHIDSLKRMGMCQRINESLLRLEKSTFSFRNSDIDVSTLQTIIRIEFKSLLMFLK